MSLFSSDDASARFGSIGVQPVLPCPPIPTIIAEWAAILPLVCHLASPRDDYITTGEIALMGKLSIAILPRLGTLSGIARLLRRGTKYLDYASTKGGSSRTVWDVKWGSVFPCANGAAMAAVSKALTARNNIIPQRVLERISRQDHDRDPEKSPIEYGNSTTGIPVHHVESNTKTNISEDEEITRRYQVLNVYQFYHQQSRPSLRQRLKRLSQATSSHILRLTVSICIATVLFLWGCYGTGATVLCASVSGFAVQYVMIRRPPGYLRNNEDHDACMLVASHENAAEWHLYIGDRGIVDSLLNKPMFLVPGGKTVRLVADLLWFANILQLAAMTFVAAQKGWDGVCLVSLLAIQWASSSPLFGTDLAADWLEREGVDAKVGCFNFTGRTAMLGAVQIFSQSQTSAWMDRIMVPHARRAIWLANLRGETTPNHLGAHDAGWVKFATESSFAGAEELTKVFRMTR